MVLDYENTNLVLFLLRSKFILPGKGYTYTHFISMLWITLF